jgi:hypothetical protein
MMIAPVSKPAGQAYATRLTSTWKAAMGYYMRYFLTGPNLPALAMMEAVLKTINPAYALDANSLTFNGERYAQIEIMTPVDSLFQEEIDEFRVEIAHRRGRRRKTVLDTLNTARAVIAAQVLFQDRPIEQTLAKLDPLWEWLFVQYPGLLQVDGEGFYTQTGLILTLE